MTNENYLFIPLSKEGSRVLYSKINPKNFDPQMYECACAICDCACSCGLCLDSLEKDLILTRREEDLSPLLEICKNESLE
ncbi:MAG: hypothetical protein QW273_01955 [Candidatus Pacearchaeota archaeon]